MPSCFFSVFRLLVLRRMRASKEPSYYIERAQPETILLDKVMHDPRYVMLPAILRQFNRRSWQILEALAGSDFPKPVLQILAPKAQVSNHWVHRPLGDVSVLSCLSITVNLGKVRFLITESLSPLETLLLHR